MGKEFVVNSIEELCDLMCPPPLADTWYDGDYGVWRLRVDGKDIAYAATFEELWDIAAEFGYEI